ncbi:uncharacterized protein FIBRA_06360 [Fibroporia radiculosa]|uniref:aminodeoxychorismate synthase n=1 Tax=Fibroporia radiculosa TaxID=599839 RepID=J4H413_9APHY|nr:uncharacterized protein FIBRA_06360 [Fibroporia radiculosa]CCM04194.1 predicted protein [Fibroporia radiculosa]
MALTSPRILLIDSYDSFTHNLAALCKKSIPDCHIHIIKNDSVDDAKLKVYLSHFSAIVVGPGPGSPENPCDIGVVRHLWRLPEEHLLPIFGVCLGLQSLAIEFGAKLGRLNVVKHGQISQIQHNGEEIFQGVKEVSAVRYHSLYVSLDNCQDLQPLAWADDGAENGPVIMAARHKTKPFWAVQYHPESVRTDGGGEEILRNFWRLAQTWASSEGRKICPWNTLVEKVVGPSWPVPRLVTSPRSPLIISTVTTRLLQIPGCLPTSICEAIGVMKENSDFVLLDSAAQPGRFTLIGCLTPRSTRIIHTVGEPHIHVRTQEKCMLEDLAGADIWAWLATFMRIRRAVGGTSESPFWGGLIGYLSYELGVQSLAPSLLSGDRKMSKSSHPDVNLVFVDRSIVVDSTSGSVYIQSLLPNDDAWLDSMCSTLKQTAMVQMDSGRASPAKRRKKSTTGSPLVSLPDREQYISQIGRAKEHLFAGDSYELCLTAPTRISVPKGADASRNSSSSWELYKILRARNPAPHSAYLRLHPSTMLSSSPERFLSYSRPPDTTCQLRPIKGTVRKAPGVTRAVAEQALAGSAKEVAENLMIVDLIRHDLHGVVGEDVSVRQFCKVEEYKTVWQLVSVIEGKLRDGSDADQSSNLGWEVLRRSLPPGSMTGAPKKRSVEILHTLEDQDRGIYSGVFGYWCVGGSGDWSVTIRSCFKYDPQEGSECCHAAGRSPLDDSTRESSHFEEWCIGAGGAITALSDPEAEWDEMIVKVDSVVRAFGDVEFLENYG